MGKESDNTRKYKVALVGCGRISSKHFNAIKQIPELKLIAVCDINKEKAEKAAKEQGCTAFTDYENMLDTAKPNVVSICTPNYLHPEQTIMAARKKIHVLTEKPIALSLEDARNMVWECKDNEVELFVVKQNRHNPPMRKIKEAMERGRFGKPYLCSVTVRWQRPQEYYEQDDWHGKLSKDGGMLINQASHHIDAMRWLMGPVESVIGVGATLGRKIETEDTALAIVKFKSGALGVIEATTLTYPHNLEGSITIQGEKGTAKVGGTALNKIDLWHFKDFNNDDDNIKNIGVMNPPDVYGSSHIDVFKNVVDCLVHNKKCDVDGMEGTKSLEMIHAIYKSHRTGKEVKFPLEGNETVLDNKF
ncbi:MAG: Gfo/Idh/MocA family oxidoreductase [Nanoarchaeota archaeon]|nr:Gfo/Idh/MocA family oxidoreductase [Nanoarchaeota archaeon]